MNPARPRYHSAPTSLNIKDPIPLPQLHDGEESKHQLQAALKHMGGNGKAEPAVSAFPVMFAYHPEKLLTTSSSPLQSRPEAEELPRGQNRWLGSRRGGKALRDVHRVKEHSWGARQGRPPGPQARHRGRASSRARPSRPARHRGLRR